MSINPHIIVSSDSIMSSADSVITYNNSIIDQFGACENSGRHTTIIKSLNNISMPFKTDDDDIVKNYIKMVKDIKNIDYIQYLNQEIDGKIFDGFHLYHKIAYVRCKKFIKSCDKNIYTIMDSDFINIFNTYLLMDNILYKILTRIDKDLLYIMKVDKVILPYFHKKYSRLQINENNYYRNNQKIDFKFPIYVCNNPDGVLELF